MIAQPDGPLKGPILRPIALAKSLHISQRLRVAYVNNPKVACSTLKLTLQQAEIDDQTYVPATSVHDHEASPLLTWPDIDAKGDPLAGLFVFSFVRNPYGRLRSSYLNKIVRPQKQGAFREQAGFDRKEVPSFRDFVLSVCAQPPREQNPHWRLQALNLSLGRIRYDFIGRLEQFSADWAALRQNLPLPETPSNAGKKTEKAASEALIFDAEMAKAVQKSYAPDFDRFDYDATPDQRGLG